jgi:hypothetical protein
MPSLSSLRDPEKLDELIRCVSESEPRQLVPTHLRIDGSGVATIGLAVNPSDGTKVIVYRDCQNHEMLFLPEKAFLSFHEPIPPETDEERRKTIAATGYVKDFRDIAILVQTEKREEDEALLPPSND